MQARYYINNTALGGNSNNFLRNVVTHCKTITHFANRLKDVNLSNLDQRTMLNFTLIGPPIEEGMEGKQRSGGVIINLRWKDDVKADRTAECDANICTLDNFLDAYVADLTAIARGTNQYLFVNEYAMHQGRFRLFMDLDIKRPSSSESDDLMLPKAFLRSMLLTIQSTICRLIYGNDGSKGEDNMGKLIVCERFPTRHTKTQASGIESSYIKNGYHLHWPNFIVSWRQALVIRHILLLELESNDVLKTHLNRHELITFSKDHWDWQEVVDKDVYGNASQPAHLRMIGSYRYTKEDNIPCYMPYVIIDSRVNWLEKEVETFRTSIRKMVYGCMINPESNQLKRSYTCIDAKDEPLIDDLSWVQKMVVHYNLNADHIDKLLSGKIKKPQTIQKDIKKYKTGVAQPNDDNNTLQQDRFNLSHRDLEELTRLFKQHLSKITCLKTYNSDVLPYLTRFDPCQNDEFYDSILNMFHQTDKHQWKITGCAGNPNSRIFLWSDCKYCPNYGMVHSSRKVFFFVDMVERAVGVRCTCKCDRNGVLGITCKQMKEIICGCNTDLFEFLNSHASGRVSRHMLFGGHVLTPSGPSVPQRETIPMPPPPVVKKMAPSRVSQHSIAALMSYSNDWKQSRLASQLPVLERPLKKPKQ